jgi:hypothetical protein
MKFKPLIAVALCGALAVSACASNPDSIQATYVSPMTYGAYTCEQLRAENARVGARVSEVTGQQRSNASADAWALGVSLVLFWPAIFFMANGDKKDELARLKGEYEAIQQSAIAKGCITA